MLFSDLQKKMTDLLVELDGILKANNIEYMLYCGSQLGADRHHGMIPWDDDADIMMSLENYDKFIDLARKGLPEGRSINALELSTDYQFCYGRYVDLTTTALQRHTIFGKCDPGVKVDVFFCVPTSSNERKAKKHQLEILAFNEILADNVNMIYRRPEEFFPYYEKEKKRFNKLGRDAYVKKRLPELKYKYASPRKKPEKYIFFSGMVGNSHFFDASEITNTKEILFEGVKVQGAANGPYYDIESYGESWYQIPGNISRPHHVWASDISTPFAEHLRDAAEYFDLDRILAMQRRRKQLRLESQLRFKEAFILKERLINLALGMSLDRKYHESGSALTLAEKYDLFKPFYSRQLRRENKWYKLPVPLSDDTLTAAVDCLVSMGDFARAIDILKFADGRTITDRKDIEKRISLSRELIYAIFVYPDQLASKEQMIEENTKVIDLTVPEAKGRLMLQRMRASEDTEERKELASEIVKLADLNMQIYGERSELLILKAFAVNELEKQKAWHGTQTSEDLFNMDIDNIRNGFILQEIIDEGYDILHSGDESSEEDDEPEEAQGTSLVHHYLEESDYNGKKAEFCSTGGADYDVKGSGEKEYIAVYKENSLAATIPEIIRGNTKDMSVREFWHKCCVGEARTESKAVTIVAENITPEEYFQRAEREGILNKKSVANYKEQRKWRKGEYGELNKEYKAFFDNFVKFMARELDK